jgi:integrase
MIKYVFRPKRKIDGKKRTARLYSGRYKLDGESQITEVPLKTTDKQVARKILDDIVKEKEMERVGLIPAANLRIAAAQPISKHLQEYLDDLHAIGRDDTYVENLEYRLRILIKECHWNRLVDVTANSFTQWRAKQVKAAKTLNQFLEAAVAMLNWMIKNRRLAQNDLQCVEKVEFKAAWKRRAFRHSEVARLLGVAGSSRIAYLLALYTGLRRAELKALRVSDLDLNAGMVTLDGQFTKNGKPACIPLHPSLISELRPIVTNAENGSSPVLSGEMLPSMWMMKKHLKLVGIPYENEYGRADFHALRHTLATNLALGNVAPRIAQEILRHSDIRLTMNHYTDASQLPIAQAIQGLPSFGAANTQIHPHGHSQTSDAVGNNQTPQGTDVAHSEASKVVYPQQFWHAKTLTDAVGQSDAENCLARTRT